MGPSYSSGRETLLTAAEVLAELKRLRKGFGIDDPGALTRTGRALRHVAGVTSADGSAEQRAKLRTCLLDLVDLLPTGMAPLGRQALGLDGSGVERFGKRLRYIALEIDRDPRTARRHVDMVLARLAEEAVYAAARRSAAERQRSELRTRQ